MSEESVIVKVWAARKARKDTLYATIPAKSDIKKGDYVSIKVVDTEESTVND